MANLEDLGEVLSTDVLIVGGGIGGFMAALKTKELNSDLDVVIVEKSYAGTAGGKANKGAGVLWVMQPEDDVDKFREYHLNKIGHYLNDQEMLEKVCATTLGVVGHLEKWGVAINRDEKGELLRLPEFPLWSLCALDLDLMETLRKTAIKAGVKIVNKTQVVDLLKKDDRVVGAVGFNILDGAYRIFKSKAVILATGSCCWMATNMWSVARGDGIAAAYRAGAVMRNAEFANFHNVGLRGNHSCQVGSQYAIYNNEGEYLAPKYCKPLEPDVDIGIFLGMEKEVMEGRGPIGFEETDFFVQNPYVGVFFRWDRQRAVRFWGTLLEKEHRYQTDRSWRPEVVPMFMGEMSAVRIDHDAKTSVPGLWAIGDTAFTGSAWAGAVPAPPGRMRGAGLMFAAVSALLSAPSVVENIKNTAEPVIDEGQARAYKEAIFAPMHRTKGLKVREVLAELKEYVVPVRYSIRKNKERMEEALAKVLEIQKKVDQISPENDLHLLGLTHDVKNMSLCAEVVYRAALERKESRGWHYREDYPERDDKNFLKWTNVKQDKGKMVVSFEDIPIERYKSKP